MSCAGYTGEVQGVVAQLEAAQTHKRPAERAPERCQQPRRRRSAAGGPARTQHALLHIPGSNTLHNPCESCRKDCTAQQ